MIKFSNLYYVANAFALKYYPKEIVDYANTRGAEKICYSGCFSMVLSLGRIFDEMNSAPFKDHIWPKFLGENAWRIFKI